MLRKARGASAVAILSLAIGIGVNTTVFSWVRGVLLNPVPGAARRAIDWSRSRQWRPRGR